MEGLTFPTGHSSIQGPNILSMGRLESQLPSGIESNRVAFKIPNVNQTLSGYLERKPYQKRHGHILSQAYHQLCFFISNHPW